MLVGACSTMLRALFGLVVVVKAVHKSKEITYIDSVDANQSSRMENCHAMIPRPPCHVVPSHEKPEVLIPRSVAIRYHWVRALLWAKNRSRTTPLPTMDVKTDFPRVKNE